MAYIKLQKEPIDVAALYQKLKDPTYGGIVTFSGIIREWTDEIQTQRIGFTAYEEMAQKELEKLAESIEAKGASVIIVHRLDVLELAEEAVFIGVAAPHRKEAFEWCEYLIDTLKSAVPIWKKEYNVDNVRWGGTMR